MSQYYNARRTTGLYDPTSQQPFKLSRSKIDLFLNCKRCFYLDRKVGVAQPPGFPFNLNSAVDALLKKEFDYWRAEQKPHPIALNHNLNLIPFQHPELDAWRHVFTGIQYHDSENNFLIFGGVDDIWQDPVSKKIAVIDYKSTSKDGTLTLDAPWQITYKRQLEIYHWLLEKNNFPMLPHGYIVYCNADKSKTGFDARLEFTIQILPHRISTAWIPETLRQIKKVLFGPLPAFTSDCDFCTYYQTMNSVVNVIEQGKAEEVVPPQQHAVKNLYSLPQKNKRKTSKIKSSKQTVQTSSLF